jgi:hypothetical protein
MKVQILAYNLYLLTIFLLFHHVESNLVLKATSPTLTIINSGGTDTTANTITFNFSKAIRNESFTVDDIGSQ